MAIVPPLPNDSSLAARGVDFVVRRTGASASELPARTASSGVPAESARPAAGLSPSEAGAVLAPDLTRLLATIDLVDGGSRADVEWPTPATNRSGAALADTPGEALANLHEALARSPMFAVRRLTERWFPATAAMLDARARGDDVLPGSGGERMVSGAVSQADFHGGPDEGARAAVPERPVPAADRPAPRDLAQAAALMIGGRLQWQGELTPGVPARLVREDHWQPERDAAGGGPQPATRFTLAVDLPNLGRVTIQAVDGAGSAAIDLFAEPLAAARLRDDLGRLQDRMRRFQGGAATVVIRSTDKGTRR